MEECNASAASGVSVKGRRYYITPTHIYEKGSDVPTIIHDSLFDTGAGPTICTLRVLKEHNLHKKIISQPGKEILGGDQRPMRGYVGYIDLDLALEDTTAHFTNTFVMRVLVFTNLNHDFIIGQNSMNHITFQGYPLLNTLLFNPSHGCLQGFSGFFSSPKANFCSYVFPSSWAIRQAKIPILESGTFSS